MYQQEAATFSLELSLLVDVHQSSNHDNKDNQKEYHGKVRQSKKIDTRIESQLQLLLWSPLLVRRAHKHHNWIPFLKISLSKH
jgi:hypothetical protein